jgi:hypothetical protein
MSIHKKRTIYQFIDLLTFYHIFLSDIFVVIVILVEPSKSPGNAKPRDIEKKSAGPHAQSSIGPALFDHSERRQAHGPAVIG